MEPKSQSHLSDERLGELGYAQALQKDSSGISIVIVGCGCGEGAIRVRGGRGDDGEGKHGQVVLLGEAYLGRRGIEGRFEGAIQRRERNFEVDDIICSRLHADALKDGVLRGALTSTRPRRDNMLTIESTLHLVRTSDTKIRSVYSRPYLCALLWYDGEAYLLLAELYPCERTERVEGRSELCNMLAGIVTLRCVHITCERGDVLYLGFEAHRARWWRGTDASRKCSERLQ